MVGPPGVKMFATLTPLPPTAMGPPALSPGLGTSSSRPPPRPTHEGGTSASDDAVAAQPGPSSSVPVVSLPPIPREILYFGVGLGQYVVPKVPLPASARDFLADFPNDEVCMFYPSFDIPYLLYIELFLILSSFFCFFQVVGV